MKKIFKAVLNACLLMFLCVGIANATLWDRGGGLIYDDVLDITWLQDANYAKTVGVVTSGAMPWFTAESWVSSLSYYDSVRDAYLDDWRLPTADQCTGYNCTNSEMGHLYYISLGNSAQDSTINVEPFDNLKYAPGQEYWYQNPTRAEQYPGLRGTFNFFVGIQGDDDVHQQVVNFVMLVLDGDVDADDDSDNILNYIDNCPDIYNPDQTDSDSDDIGDACDPFPYDSDHEKAQLEEDLAQAQADLSLAQTELTQCTTDLALSDASLTQCTTDLTECSSNYSQCTINFTQCSTALTECSADLTLSEADFAECTIDLILCEADLDQCLNPPEITKEGPAQTCSDGIDNDGDGDTDCADDGCTKKKVCKPQ